MDQAPQRTIGASAPESGDGAAAASRTTQAAQDARAAGAPAQTGGTPQQRSSARSESPARGSGPGRWPFQLGLLACYIAAGVAVTWPRASYLTAGRLPGNLDQSTYVWDFWWIAHQVTHLGNPWATSQLAAPVGVQLGFDTLMPLPGLLMTPITLAFGPSVSYNLLGIIVPGLACYLAYRAARLWLSTATGAIAAGAFYGLATVQAFQDWYHLNVALGTLFFPLALETSVRLRRRPGVRQAVLVGLVLGASFLVNQESAIMAVLVAAPVLLAWLLSSRSAAALRQTAIAAGVTVLVATPQIIAMIAQAASGAATLPAVMIAHQDTRYGVPVDSMFAPSPRTRYFGLNALASFFHYQTRKEGIPTFGVMLTVLAVGGLMVAWKRPGARALGAAWAACAVVALGSVLRIGHDRLVPLAVVKHGASMSLLLPYTWLIHIPGLSGFREPDRVMLVGLLPAAILAGFAVERLRSRAPALLAVALALAVLEAGFSGSHFVKTMPTATPALDAPIAADHSGSLVVDVPFGLGGGLGIYGGELEPQTLVMATADGHPRSVSATSWVPVPTVKAIAAHPFYRDLVAAEQRRSVVTFTAAQAQAARRDALAMRVGWAVVWRPAGRAVSFLRQTGFTFERRVDKALLFRLAPAAGSRAGEPG
jgi:hypothetical protein